MTVASDKERDFAKKERTTLEKVAYEETEAGSLARTWLQHKLGPMEQEALDPLPSK